MPIKAGTFLLFCMNKQSALFFLLLLIVQLVRAQEFKFGVKAGANASTIYGDFTEGFQPRIGFQLGGFMVFEVDDNFYFQPEVFYSSQGVIFDTDLQSMNPDGQSLGTDIRTNTQNNFLSLPLIVGFRFNRKLTLEAGPQFGFLLNQVVKVKEEDNITDELKSSGNLRLDYGLAAGVSYKLTDNMLLQPRVYLGIANNLRDDPFSLGAQNRNLSFQLSIAHIFN